MDTHHPTLFKDELVRAIMKLLKTQTRRIVTMHNSLIDGTGEGVRSHWPHLQLERAWVDPGPSPAGNPGPYIKAPCRHLGDADDLEVVHRVYPRVQVGDLLWVKEAWAPHALSEHQDPPERVIFRADGANWGICGRGPDNLDAEHWPPEKWRSPIHLRKDTARIWLKVIQVRAQRIQEIIEPDCVAEGVGVPFLRDCKKPRFMALWDKINGSRPGCSWKANPWVWAYTFEHTERPEL
jgi:hypothetical protein